MANLLYIKASPMENRSYSNRTAEAFLEAYIKANPDDSIEALDLWKTDLPPFDFIAAEGKYKVMRGKDHTEEEKKAWGKIIKTAEHFKSFDKVLLSVPMWNFSIPYRLKHYLDVIVQPGLTFSFSPEKGYTGLVTGKPIQLIAARGGAYKEGTEAEVLDSQLSYLKLIFGFIGFSDIRTITVEPTLAGGPDAAEVALKSSIKLAEAEGKNF